MEEKEETLENLDVFKLYQKANAEHLVHIKELSRQIKSVTTKDKMKFWFVTRYAHDHVAKVWDKTSHEKENYFKIIDAVPEQAISDCEKIANEMVEVIFQNIFHSNSGFELTEKIPLDYKVIVDEVKFKTSMQVNITDNVKESICKLDKEFDEFKSKSFAALLSFLENNKEFYNKLEYDVFADAFTIVSNYFIDKIENNLRDKVAKEFATSYPMTIFIDKFDEIKICVGSLRILTSDNNEKYIHNVVIDKEVKASDIKKICIEFIVKADLF